VLRSARTIVAILIIAAVPLLSHAPHAATTAAPTIDQFLSPAYPQDLVAAKNIDRIAWWSYERGQRNVYTAAAPAFRPVRLTQFLDDNGVEISDVNISDDGSVVTFVRGVGPNREGWAANPTSDPRGADRTIWAVRTTGGAAWRLGDGSTPEPSPDGRSVVYAKDGQIYSYRVALAGAPQGSALQKGPDTTPFIKAWGTNGNMQWSPDGTKIAFVSNRVDHSFIGIYDVRTRAVKFLSPSVDHDTSPTWSPDGTSWRSSGGPARRSASRHIRARAASAIRMDPRTTR
jgi:dipeptidyl aminopeptidase/acylaminoacyl peptidase